MFLSKFDPYVPGSINLLKLGMIIPPIVGNLHIGCINCYYWVTIRCHKEPMGSANSDIISPGPSHTEPQEV